LIEYGDRWDEPLTKFDKGKINLNFYNNVVGYTAGDCVSGTIDICLQEHFDFDELILEFVGLERSFLNTKSLPGLQPERFHRDAKEIVHLRQVVRVFTGYGMDPGQYSYPFQLYLPEWLPESIDLHLPNEEQFHVEYTVRA